MFWEIFSRLCSEINKKPNAVCNELGFSNATATHWKRGKQPGSTSLEKISGYFNVSVDFLLGKTDKKNKAIPEGQPLTEEQEALIASSSDLSNEDLKKVIEYIELLKLRGNQ